MHSIIIAALFLLGVSALPTPQPIPPSAEAMEPPQICPGCNRSTDMTNTVGNTLLFDVLTEPFVRDGDCIQSNGACIVEDKCVATGSLKIKVRSSNLIYIQSFPVGWNVGSPQPPIQGPFARGEILQETLPANGLPIGCGQQKKWTILAVRTGGLLAPVGHYTIKCSTCPDE